MTDIRAARGRPKGSGLNDRDQLLAVARLIASNPGLKPTTAIRSTGITDPSAIRRLRDKFQLLSGELMAEARSDETPVRTRAVALSVPQPKKKKAPRAELPVTSAVAAVEAAGGSTADATCQFGAKSSPLAPADNQTVSAPQTAALPVQPLQWVTAWYGLGVRGMSTAIGLQISFLENVMRMPHVANALRGQVVLNELAASFVAPRPVSAPTVH